jgi:16S rRNA (guanine527-N7)-methyltransferase
LSHADARAALQTLDRLLVGQANAPNLPPGFAEATEAYVGLLLDANRRLNLTRVVEPDAIARLHLLDSLAALPWIDELAPHNALDLGSGGGVPGLVLAIARPSIAWTLVDAVGKKADAMRSFAIALGLGNVRVIAERAETLGRMAGHRESYELVTARACAPLPVLAEYALPLVRIGGALLAWKGRSVAGELAGGAVASAALGGGTPSVHPSGHEALGDHRFVCIRKERSTPAAYPRRPGEPGRRPLG